jgi:hypothetical protein
MALPALRFERAVVKPSAIQFVVDRLLEGWRYVAI